VEHECRWSTGSARHEMCQCLQVEMNAGS
jgi:hypothetical protein